MSDAGLRHTSLRANPASLQVVDHAMSARVTPNAGSVERAGLPCWLECLSGLDDCMHNDVFANRFARGLRRE